MLALVPIVFATLLFGAFAFVVRFGRWPERAGIIIISVAAIASALVAQHDLWRSGETGIFVVDLLALGAFVAVLGLTDRFWTLWVTALQIVAVMTHLARFLKPSTLPMAYAVAEQIWAYLMIAIVVASVFRQEWRTATAKPSSGSRPRSVRHSIRPSAS